MQQQNTKNKRATTAKRIRTPGPWWYCENCADYDSVHDTDDIYLVERLNTFNKQITYSWYCKKCIKDFRKYNKKIHIVIVITLREHLKIILSPNTLREIENL